MLSNKLKSKPFWVAIGLAGLTAFISFKPKMDVLQQNNNIAAQELPTLQSKNPPRWDCAKHFAAQTKLALSTCLAQAQSGDAKAQFNVGLLMRPDWQAAMKWILAAALQGEPQAQYLAAQSYLSGQGVPENVKEAEHWLILAAQNGVAQAQYELAMSLESAQMNSGEVYKWYLAAASQNHPQAAYEIGTAQLFGKYQQTINIENGAQWLKIAAEQNYAPAQLVLASLFMEGYSVLPDKFKAIEYLRPTANMGLADAQYKLARLLLELSLPQYDKVAFFWLKQADAQQHAAAKYLLAECHYQGIGTDINFHSAFHLFKELAAQQHPLAQFKLAQMYHHGHGVPKNNQAAKKWVMLAAQGGVSAASKWTPVLFKEDLDEKAEQDEDMLAWLKFAVENGDAKALYLTGKFHLYGLHGFQQNIHYGIELIQTAALNQIIAAQRELAKIYQQGLFGLNDPGAAYKWYLQASENGDEYSQYQLANIYYSGDGAAKDFLQSYAWAHLAASNGEKNALMLKNEIAGRLHEEEIIAAKHLAKSYIQKYRTGK